MARWKWIAVVVSCTAVGGALTVSRAASPREWTGERANPSSTASGQVYRPYRPGLLPSDLQPEIDRVNAEIEKIFAATLAEWRRLPIDPGTGMRQVELLGKLEQFDRNLSVHRNQACVFCHMPYTGFSGPISSVNATTVAYPGSVRFRFGKRKPQAYTYSPFYPSLGFNATQQDFYGGNFWDLRATGQRLQSPDAEQAQGPPHDTQEMGLPDTACVVYRLSQTVYRPLFEIVWGRQAFAIRWPGDVEKICNTPGGAAAFHGDRAPVKLTKEDRDRANATFDQFALAISAYERSPDVSAFSSKFDAYLAGSYTLTADERAGYDLFRGKAMCNTCHLDGTSNGSPAITAANAASVAPLFTDFTSSNLGIPRNPDNPFYDQDVPDAFGFVANPTGRAFVDLGVGLFLRGKSGTPPREWAPLAPKFDGKMQVATLRNVDLRPCPGFVKSYMHNGYLKSLKEVVHFYNTRDTLGACTGKPGEVEKVTCWPPPEIRENVDTKTGNLGLSDAEEEQIVAFLKTLTDGFTRPYTDLAAYTGKCN
jgi:cytochrome c peroxidase